MKRTWILVVITMRMLAGLGAAAAGPDDLYVQLYSSLQQADTLNQNGQYRSAAEKYREIQDGLKKLQTTYPTWNPKIVSYRMGYVSERLQALTKFLTPIVAAPPTANLQVASKKTDQVEALNAEIRRLQAEKGGLEEKLREAFTIKPAAESEQLAKAEEKIAALEKERDLLKVTLDQAKARPSTTAAASAGVQEPDARKIRQLERERDELQKKLDSAVKQQASQEARYQAQLKTADAKLQQLEQLNRDREQLEQKQREALALATTGDGKISKRDAKRLKKLEDEKSDLQKKFNEVSRDLTILQNEREKRIKDHELALNRIKELEKERDSLREQLRNGGKRVAGDSEVARENEFLKSRVEAYEARPVPFTPEELALFKTPTAPSTPQSFVLVTKAKPLPSKAREIVADADNDFAAQRFEDAEKKYEKVVNEHKDNVYALANLASTQIELNRIEEAEANVQRALKAEPQDAFSLLLLGKIKMGQSKYDEALDALSRSAQINPKSAETFNYLGICLSEKGQRVPAEAALRKSIQIQPDYASAHHNLAIIYATQKPPFLELARWHYQKAISLGHAKNPDLEKLIPEKTEK